MHRMMWTAVGVTAWASAAQAGATDYFTETVKDFGVSPRGPVLTHYFLVRNTSGRPVDIGTPRVSCGCTSASVLKSHLAAGETTAVAAYMDTRRIPTPGALKAVTVYVPFLTPVPEEVHLRVQCVARDDLVLTPDVLSFGTVRRGRGGSAVARVTFYGDPAWQVTGASSTGAYIKPAVAPAARAAGQVSYDVTAALDPACPPGNWTADVWLTATGAGVDRLRIPVAVTVVAPIAVNPEAVRFGPVKVGVPAERRVVLQAGGPFRVVEVKGAGGPVAVSPPAADAKPVQVLTLTLTAAAAGEFARTLEVVTDSKDQPAVAVPLTATASRE